MIKGQDRRACSEENVLLKSYFPAVLSVSRQISFRFRIRMII